MASSIEDDDRWSHERMLIRRNTSGMQIQENT